MKLSRKTKIQIVVCLCLFFVIRRLIHNFLQYYKDPNNLIPMVFALNQQQYILPTLKICKNCNNFNYDYTIENKDFCGRKDIFLFIAVTSHHPNTEARRTIRKTWGSIKQHKGLNIVIGFFFGLHSNQTLNKMIKLEAEQHHDIVQANFADQYTTLSNKSIMAMGWIKQYCPQAKYILKSDDNTYNVPERYVDYLIHNTVHTFIGSYCFPGWPARNESHTFYTPYMVYQTEYYPMYCWGPAYLMSYSALEKVVQVAPHVIFLPWEDVWITGICREAAAIPYMDIAGTGLYLHDITDECSDKGALAKSLHPIKPNETAYLWKELNTLLKSRGCYKSWITVKDVIYFVLALCFLFMLYKYRKVNYRRLHFATGLSLSLILDKLFK